MKEEPIRIAQIMGKMVGGGVESVVMNYYRNIDKTKIQFDFICDSDSTNIPLHEIKSLGGKVILIPPYQKIWQYHKQLKKILKQNQYQIIHSHINTLSVFPLHLAKKIGIPIRIAHSHSTTSKKEWKRNFLKQILRPFSKIYATHYFCCSELAGRWQFGNSLYEEGKVFLMKNAINLEKFKFNNEIRKNIRQELNLGDDTLVIGHIGRFVSVKNHQFLLKIFNEIHKKNKKSVLLLTGQGPLENEVMEKARQLKLDKFVIHLGQRNDINQIYQALDIFLLPSLYEGLPVVGIEAQASGLLCFLSNNVTRETKILKTTTFVSLEKDEKEWSEIILTKYKNFSRKDKSKVLKTRGFDIKIEANKLKDKYIELLKSL